MTTRDGFLDAPTSSYGGGYQEAEANNPFGNQRVNGYDFPQPPASYGHQVRVPSTSH
jgi:hypothetical protein